jgi:hypothetical protein
MKAPAAAAFCFLLFFSFLLFFFFFFGEPTNNAYSGVAERVDRPVPYGYDYSRILLALYVIIKYLKLLYCQANIM